MSRIPNTFASAETEKKELLMKLEKGEFLYDKKAQYSFRLPWERKEICTWNNELNFLYIFSPHHFSGGELQTFIIYLILAYALKISTLGLFFLSKIQDGNYCIYHVFPLVS